MLSPSSSRVPQVEFSDDNDGSNKWHLLVIHSLGDHKSKWIVSSTSERLHMALTLKQVIQSCHG
jgi:hypothetical protein